MGGKLNVCCCRCCKSVQSVSCPQSSCMWSHNATARVLYNTDSIPANIVLLYHYSMSHRETAYCHTSASTSAVSSLSLMS